MAPRTSQGDNRSIRSQRTLPYLEHTTGSINSVVSEITTTSANRSISGVFKSNTLRCRLKKKNVDSAEPSIMPKSKLLSFFEKERRSTGDAHKGTAITSASSVKTPRDDTTTASAKTSRSFFSFMRASIRQSGRSKVKTNEKKSLSATKTAESSPEPFSKKNLFRRRDSASSVSTVSLLSMGDPTRFCLFDRHGNKRSEVVLPEPGQSKVHQKFVPPDIIEFRQKDQRESNLLEL